MISSPSMDPGAPLPESGVVRAACPHDCPDACAMLVTVEKGSITVDGVSLTVTDVSGDGGTTARFGVALIPHTLSSTTLGRRDVGAVVNLEVDVLAKYVARLLAPMVASSKEP